jgi:hypothetical protein
MRRRELRVATLSDLKKAGGKQKLQTNIKAHTHIEDVDNCDGTKKDSADKRLQQASTSRSEIEIQSKRYPQWVWRQYRINGRYIEHAVIIFTFIRSHHRSQHTSQLNSQTNTQPWQPWQ